MNVMLRCLLVMMVFTVAAFAPVSAADEIGLSRDGVKWSGTLADGLFDPAMRWVPGDSDISTFYVRNQGPSSAFLTIEARSADSDKLLSNDDIDLAARADGGAWVSLQNGEPSDELADQSIARSGVVPVDVRVTFDPHSKNSSQIKALALAFNVTLVDSLERDADVSGSGGVLPGTGASVSPTLIWIGAMLLGAGLALVARRKDRDEE